MQHADLAESTRARHGPTGKVRSLTAKELPLLRDHLLRLDRDSRRDRFNGSLDDNFVVRYAIKCVSDGTVVLAYVEDGMVRGAAELHQPDLSPGSLPEIAFSVEACVRRRGVGSILFTTLIGKARALGYDSLRITTSAQNDAMRALAKKFGAHLTFRAGESAGTIEVRQKSHDEPAGSAASLLDVIPAMMDYNRACWGLAMKFYGFGRSA